MGYLRCGDLQEGFARVRCGDCGHEMFVTFSGKQRCTCPSCHQKRTLLTAIHVAEDVCAAVPHGQVVLTIPKRLRVPTRFDRTLLGKLCAAAWPGLLDKLNAELKQGVNRLMVKVFETVGDWNFGIAVSDEDGLPITEGLWIRIDTNNTQTSGLVAYRIKGGVSACPSSR